MIDDQKKINLMHIRDSKGIYGAERVMLTIGNNIDKEKYNLSFLCLRNSDRKSDEFIQLCQKFNINVIPLDVIGRLNLLAIKKMRNILKQNKVSIINTHDFKSDFYGLVSSINLGVKRVATAGGSTRDTLLKRAYLFLDEKIVYKFYDCIISVSYKLKDFLIKRKVNPQKIHVIQNGLDFDLLKKQSTEKKDDARNITLNADKVFAVIGRLYPDKGHRFFLTAIANMLKDYPNIQGLIVGDGPEKEIIVNQINELKIDNSVSLCGQVSNMLEVYNKIDYIVIPSLREGLPYVLLEAMAAGIPVVASDVGDISFLIQNEKTGYVIPPGNADQLEKRMRDLIEFPEKSKEMAIKAQKHVMEKYSAREMTRKTEKLYFDLISSSL